MKALVHARFSSRLWPGLVLALAAVLPVINGSDQSTAAISFAAQTTAAMNTFVIIFRQGPRTLTDAEIKQRAQETSAWARRHNDAGHKLDPHILRPERAVRGVESPAAHADAWPVTAILFLEAGDLNEAAAVAEAHPALRYGASVEVRPWAPPAPVAPPAKPSPPAP